MLLHKYKTGFIILFFAIIYALISLVNHYCFRTYALDLGAYTNAMFDYIHFRYNDSAVFKEIPENLLSDHFDLYLILFSPLIFIFKTYTLLIVQIVAILAGGWGIYKYFIFIYHKENNKVFAMIMMISFFLFFGIYSALSYDYHSNVVASMFVPFLFLSIRKEAWIKAFLILVLICIAKENMSLWMSFVMLGLMFEYRKNVQGLRILTLFFIFCLIYFYVITQWVMPALSNEGKFYQFKYSVLGDNYFSALKKIILHPVDTLKILFINHTNEPKAEYVKGELHIILFFSGLWAALFKPQFILMLIPIYFQKLFHDNYLIWGIDGQYSIEFAPILVIAAGEFFISIKNKKRQIILAALLLLFNLFSTIRIMDRTILFTNKSRIRIYQTSHYQRNFNIQNVYSAIEQIPDTSVVSAQTSILPHLALRDKIYSFPIIKDAQYIILNTKDDTYPLDSIAYKTKVHQLLKDSLRWKIIMHKENVLLLKVRQ